ncbi:uncharacterized protein LOC120832726 [Gasterosteus aculeatus]
MSGRGVKRKRSCPEEPQAETLPAAGQEGRNGGHGAGPQHDLSRLQQRQRVLGLCMEKLQGQQAGAEPSLRRCVLLANTLRQIQVDMQSDGGAAAALLGDGHHPGGFAAVTCSACSDPPPEGPSQDANGPPEQQRSPPAAFSAVSDAVSAIGYLGDLALDIDIFEDIDTSMFDTSELPSCWAAAAAGSPWPLSVSLWADEDAKTRPPRSLQSRLTDLNELDHIMEILVKS